MKKILQIVLVLGIVMYTAFLVTWMTGHTEYRVDTIEVDIPLAEVKRDSLDMKHPLADRFFKKYNVKTTIEPGTFPGSFKVTHDSTYVDSYYQ